MSVGYAPDGKPSYQCDHCGNAGAWGETWAWYGSIKQLEDRGMKGVPPVIVTCSNDCRVALVAAGLLPTEGLTDCGDVAA